MRHKHGGDQLFNSIILCHQNVDALATTRKKGDLHQNCHKRPPAIFATETEFVTGSHSNTERVVGTRQRTQV